MSKGYPGGVQCGLQGVPKAPCPQNAMRATVESHENSPQLPTIRVLVALGQEDLSIKVCAGTPPAPPPQPPPIPACHTGFVVTVCHLLQMSDRGMGVPLRKIERLFSYMYSTAPTPQLGAGGAPMVGAPLVGGEGGRDLRVVCGDTWGSGAGRFGGGVGTSGGHLEWCGDIWGRLGGGTEGTEGHLKWHGDIWGHGRWQ